MSQATIDSPPVARARPRWVRHAPWALLACWVVVLALGGWYGERAASLDRLVDAVRSGRIDSVQVEPGLPAGAHGSWTQQIHWREGLWRHRATVRVTTGASHRSESGDGVTTVHGRDVATTLRADDPDLVITRVPAHRSESELYGWSVSGLWLGTAAFALIVLTLALLIGGPEPRWATRWAWFWLMATPLGTLLYAVQLGLPPDPRADRKRRVGGLGALVLAGITSSVLPTWWSS